MNHANKTTEPISGSSFLTETNLNTERCSGWTGDENPVNYSQLGHRKWLTRQEACDSVQPRLPQLTEKQARPLQKNNADITDSISRFMKVQALWGGA